MNPSRYRYAVPVLVSLALFAGCNKSELPRNRRPRSPPRSIRPRSRSRKSTRCSRARPTSLPENPERAQREILDKLIDAELAQAEAETNQLDRSPAVVQALEAAKTEVLARAYVEQFTGQQPKPTAEEVKKYYAEHPGVFQPAACLQRRRNRAAGKRGHGGQGARGADREESVAAAGARRLAQIPGHRRSSRAAACVSPNNCRSNTWRRSRR